MVKGLRGNSHSICNSSSIEATWESGLQINGWHKDLEKQLSHASGLLHGYGKGRNHDKDTHSVVILAVNGCGINSVIICPRKITR